MHLDLDTCRWQVRGYWPHTPLFARSVELGTELMGVTEWVDAKVPGGVHGDLLRAGVWRHHGEWWDSSARDRAIFGKPSSLDFQGESDQDQTAMSSAAAETPCGIGN